MKRSQHPTFAINFKSILTRIWIVTVVFLGGGIWASETGYRLAGYSAFSISGLVLVIGIYYLYRYLRNQPCPQCKETLTTFSDKDSDAWLAPCQKCNVIWEMHLSQNSKTASAKK